MSKTNLIFGDAAAIASGETGVFNSVYTMAGVYAGMSDDPDFEVVGVLPPAPDNGERGKIGYSMMWASSVVAISADSPNKEIAMKWLNYLFTEEGALLANFGIEGDTFEFDANGEPHYTEKMTNNPDGWNLAQCMSFYTNPPSFIPCSYAWYRELAGVPDEVIDITTYWQGQPNDYVMPAAMSLSSEENREYASLYTDISTYASERLTQFITGVANIDTEWDAYVAQIKAMGIDRCVEIQQ